MHIFLIGFMGSGKTYWGKLWAEVNGFSFIDLDHEIELAAGRTVAAIFENNEEAYFRELESGKLKDIVLPTNAIIACGGGTPCFHNNMEWMNNNGLTVYLKTTPPDILERVKDEKHKRPLLKNLDDENMLLFIAQKIQEREPFYSQAKIILPVGELNTNTIQTIKQTSN